MQWDPKGRDLLATSSDFLRIYEVNNDNSGDKIFLKTTDKLIHVNNSIMFTIEF